MFAAAKSSIRRGEVKCSPPCARTRPNTCNVHIAQFAREIAHEAALEAYVAPSKSGIGFICLPQPEPVPDFARAILALPQFLNDSPALIGHPESPARRPSGEGTIKVFRLTRLARRLRDIEADAAGDPPES